MAETAMSIGDCAVLPIPMEIRVKNKKIRFMDYLYGIQVKSKIYEIITLIKNDQNSGTISPAKITNFK
jgi:hypothetical protein